MLNDFEAFGKDMFDDKPVAVMSQFGFGEYLFKPDILFRDEFETVPVDSGICSSRASDLLFRGYHIVDFSMTQLWSVTQPRRASTFVC